MVIYNFSAYILVGQHIDILGIRYPLDNLCCLNTLSLYTQFSHPMDYQNSHPDKYRMVDVDLVDKQHFYRKLRVLRIRSYTLFGQKQEHWSYKLQCQHNFRCFCTFRQERKLLLGTRGSLGSRCFCYILEHICRWRKLGLINNLVPICRVLKFIEYWV